MTVTWMSHARGFVLFRTDPSISLELVRTPSQAPGKAQLSSFPIQSKAII